VIRPTIVNSLPAYRYRRGKTESNDVDVVFCPPEDGGDVGLLHDLYMRMGDLGEIIMAVNLWTELTGMRAIGIITHVLR
jgi:hypothetical protein